MPAVITACPQCGATAYPEARFCASCGTSFTPGSVTEDPLFARLREATHGEFDLVRPLGRGGMAAVFLAWDLKLTRYVAIKVMFPDLADSDTMPQRFLQEARTAANLDDHPNIVRVYRAEERRGLRYFVMKFVDGCSLEQLLKVGGALPIDVASFVLEQMAEALHYAHQRGVIHRDVKPGNVMLDRHGLVVVTDFGIAKVAQGEQLTKTGFAIGTPPYMSPEQWSAEASGGAADQYALGVIAYQTLTGRLPFTGSVIELLQQHLNTPPRPIRELRPDCPPELEAAVLRMLEKKAADRWPTLADALPALDSSAYGRSSALRARLGALIPSVTGLESGIPPTPNSPIPLGRTPQPTPAPVSPAPIAPIALTPPPVEVKQETPPPITPQPAPPPAPLAVAVALEHTSLTVGERMSAVAHVIDESGEHVTTAEVTWSSSAPDVATVSATGEVTALAPGRAHVVARHARLSGDASLLVIARPEPVKPAVEPVVEPAVEAELGETAETPAPEPATPLPAPVPVPMPASAAHAPSPRVEAPAFVEAPAQRSSRGVGRPAAAVVAVLAIAAAVWRTMGGSPSPAPETKTVDAPTATIDSTTRLPATTDVPAAGDSTAVRDSAPPAATTTAAIPARIVVQTPRDGVTLVAGDSVRLAAYAADAAGRELREPAVAWRVTDPGVARVSGGWLVALAAGRAQLVASAGPARATQPLSVGARIATVPVDTQKRPAPTTPVPTVDSVKPSRPQPDPSVSSSASNTPTSTGTPAGAAAAVPPLSSDVAESGASAIAQALGRGDRGWLGNLLGQSKDGAELSEGFLNWLKKATYKVSSHSSTNVATNGGRAFSDVNVKLRWVSGFGGRTREDDVELRASWRREGTAWKIESLRLRSKFPP